MLHLNRQEIAENRSLWEEKGFALYSFDDKAVIEETKKHRSGFTSAVVICSVLILPSSSSAFWTRAWPVRASLPLRLIMQPSSMMCSARMIISMSTSLWKPMGTLAKKSSAASVNPWRSRKTVRQTGSVCLTSLRRRRRRWSALPLRKKV